MASRRKTGEVQSDDEQMPSGSKRNRLRWNHDEEALSQMEQATNETGPSSSKRTRKGKKEVLQQGQQQVRRASGNNQVQRRKPPEVNAIYRRDIASFLPREKVEEWRLTSQFSDAALSEFPSKLPFRRYFMLEIATWSGVRKLGKNGFVDNAQGSPYGKGKAFQTIFDFRFCCKGLEGSAQKLVGELLFPGKPEEDVVIFRITPSGGCNRQAALRILNRLTEKTAFGFLHFVWHAGRNCCYKSFNFDLGELATVEEGAMNPRVLRTIKRELALDKEFRFHALDINSVDVNRLEPNNTYQSQLLLDWSVERVRAAQLLIDCKKVSYSFQEDEGADTLQSMLPFFGIAGGLASKAEVDYCTIWGISTAPFIDPVIQHFLDLPDGLGSSIADIRFVGMLLGWPTLCPKEKAVSHDDDVYVFHFKNTATQEGFKVSLRRLEMGWDEWISHVHLTIDR